MTQVGFVTLTAEGVPTVTVRQDSTPAQITGGYGGWTVENRERRKGLTQWDGRDPIRMQIAVLFDGVRGGKGQELAISHLSRMALPPEGGGEPPQVRVDGPGIPKPGPELWVIESLNWGTNVLWEFDDGGSMVRTRQDCVINILEYVAEDRVAFANIRLASTTKTGKSSSGWPKKYKVKAGDKSLSQIASRKEVYGKASLWRKIADANGITDPRSIKVGEVLKVPKP